MDYTKDWYLFTSCTGSHMWNMDKPDSDYDISRCRVMNTDKFLLGTRPNNHNNKGLKGSDFDFMENPNIEVDVQTYEIANVINQLKKFNINMVWMVMSPIILQKHGSWYQHLRQIVSENPSKQIYHSIRGMAKSNIKKYLEKRDLPDELYIKKLNTIARTIQFGINYMLYGKFIFEKTKIKSKPELDDLMIRFETLWNSSKLPEHPNPEPFDNFLKKLRLHVIKRVYCKN